MSPHRTVRLGEVADFINGDRGKNYPSASDFVDDGIPFINAGHLNGGEIDFSHMTYISESRFNRLGSGKTKPKDLLYCLRGSLGKTAIVRYSGDAAIASSLVIIRPASVCNARYLYHFLISPAGKAEIGRFDNGSSQPNLSATSVKQYLLPLPRLEEQRWISEILDKVVALRAKRSAALGQLDYLIQSIFLDLFGDPATNTRAFPRQPLASLIREGDTINYGVVQPGDNFDDGVPLIRVGDLHDGRVNKTSVKRIDHAIEKNYKRSRLRGDEILVSCVGSPGVIALVDESVKGYNIARAVARIPLTDEIDRIFMANYLKTGFVQRYFRNELRTVSQPTLNIKQIAETVVVLPPVDQQHEFARRVAAVEKLKATQRASLDEMDALFASLQHRAFQGHL